MNSAERHSPAVRSDRERPRGLRRLIFIVLAATLSFAVSGAVLFAADLYAHHRASRTAGLNVWGYRGPVAGSKQPGEVRLAFLGGSTLFGYGVAWNEAIPAVVERHLRSTFGGSPPFSAINLGYNNEGAYSFLYTLQDYEYLDYDVVVLYEGYNDLRRSGAAEYVRLPAAVRRLQPDRVLSDSAAGVDRKSDGASNGRQPCGGLRSRARRQQDRLYGSACPPRVRRGARIVVSRDRLARKTAWPIDTRDRGTNCRTCEWVRLPVDCVL